MNVLDTLGGSEAPMCVKIVVPHEEDVNWFIPLEPATPGANAECPDNATLAQMAADYRSTVISQPGVLDLQILGVTCTWIVSRVRPCACKVKDGTCSCVLGLNLL